MDECKILASFHAKKIVFFLFSSPVMLRLCLVPFSSMELKKESKNFDLTFSLIFIRATFWNLANYRKMT